MIVAAFVFGSKDLNDFMSIFFLALVSIETGISKTNFIKTVI